MTAPTIEGYSLFNETAADIVSGSFSPDPAEILNNISHMLLSELRSFSGTAAVILVMAMLSSAIGTLNSSLGESSGGRAAFFTFFTVISGLALTAFSTALSYGAGVMTEMTAFMNKLTPVLILSVFACGRAASAAAFEPVLSASVYVISLIIERCLIPLMAFSAVLSVAGNIDEKNSVAGFIKIVRSVSKWLLALIITLFTGINTVYGFSAASLDAVSAKTIRFAIGSFVPVVGGFLSDTLDTVTTSAGLIKNAVGVAGIVIMCVICIVPILKLGIMQLMLKLVSAIVEPITDKRISAMLWGMSEAVTAIFGTLILTTVMFVINICIILRVTG